MSQFLPFPIQNFEAHCEGLRRVGIDPGYVMYTNHHASHHLPVARLLTSSQLAVAQAYIASPSDESFRHLVEIGALFDTEWDRATSEWQIISFAGWEALHSAFSHLYAKSRHDLMEITGGDLDFTELA